MQKLERAGELTTAVVLAAGRGTRMSHPKLPKPLVPVSGKPMLERVLIGIAAAGYQRVVIVIGFRRHLVKKRFGTTFEGLALEYAVQHEQQGTAHAVSCATEFLQGEGEVLLAWADILVISSWYKTLTALWSERPGLVALTTVVYANPSLGSQVEFNNQLRMTGITSRPRDIAQGWRDGGVGIHSTESISAMERVGVSARGEKQVTTAVQTLLARRRPVGVAIYDGPWCDLANADSIRDAEARFAGLLT